MQVLMFLLVFGGEFPSAQEVMTPKNERELAIMGYAILTPLQQGLKQQVDDLSITSIQETLKDMIESYPNMLYVCASESDSHRSWGQYSRDNVDPSVFLAKTESWSMSRTELEAKKFQIADRMVYEFVLPIYGSIPAEKPELYLRLGFVMETPANQKVL